MNDGPPDSFLQLRSRMTSEGRLELSLDRSPLRQLNDDEVLIRIEATPINPTDIGLMFGSADLGSLEVRDDKTIAAIAPAALPFFAGRLDLSLPVGSEGAGTVIKAGREAQAMLGRTVAISGGEMFAELRVAKAADCLPLPTGMSAIHGASAFINPLTALGMVKTMEMEGHAAIIHTAAASNVGQMLNRLCINDGIPLVNVVRSDEQRSLLTAQGAKWICNSGEEDFAEQLAAAIDATRATIAFDAIGGAFPGQFLAAMERAAIKCGGGYSHYGSTQPKRVYVYGALDTSPLVIPRAMGMAWDVGGWLLFHFLDRVGPKIAAELRQRVADNLTTIFATRFDKTISLAEAIRPEFIKAYTQRMTGKKYAIDPTL